MSTLAGLSIQMLAYDKLIQSLSGEHSPEEVEAPVGLSFSPEIDGRGIILCPPVFKVLEISEGSSQRFFSELPSRFRIEILVTEENSPLSSQEGTDDDDPSDKD